jgi:hypothetical protein
VVRATLAVLMVLALAIVAWVYRSYEKLTVRMREMASGGVIQREGGQDLEAEAPETQEAPEAQELQKPQVVATVMSGVNGPVPALGSTEVKAEVAVEADEGEGEGEGERGDDKAAEGSRAKEEGEGEEEEEEGKDVAEIEVEVTDVQVAGGGAADIGALEGMMRPVSKIATYLKMAVQYQQVACLFPFVFQIEYPTVYEEFIGSLTLGELLQVNDENKNK